MFGGASIFLAGKVFALVNHDGFAHLKVNDFNRDRYTAAASTQHGTTPYFSIPEDVLADGGRLLERGEASA